MIVKDSLEQFFGDAEARHAEPLWTVMHAMVPPRPEPKAVPTIWRYAEMRPLLERSGALISAADAERRVLMLVNPALKLRTRRTRSTPDFNLFFPGEVARAHRHVAFALRFIVEGNCAYTPVGRKKVTMGRGDLVLTPSFEYHDHGHEGESPMVWLDGLDLPVPFLPGQFR